MPCASTGFFLRIRRPPSSPLFPYTTLFRSHRRDGHDRGHHLRPELLRRPHRQHAEDRRVLLARSEEHTSELQSHVNLVCRLLLEKKKHRGTRRTPKASPPQRHPEHAAQPHA